MVIKHLHPGWDTYGLQEYKLGQIKTQQKIQLQIAI